MARSRSSEKLAAHARSSLDVGALPTSITGRERPSDILADAFPVHVGHEVRVAFERMRLSSKDDCVTFVAASSATTAAGIDHSCLVPLVERGLVDVLVTTAASLQHDVLRVLASPSRLSAPRRARALAPRPRDSRAAARAPVASDALLCALLQEPGYQRKMSTPELLARLGRDLAAIEDARGVSSPSLLATCFRYGVPVFCSAVQDGLIFQSIVKLRRLLGSALRLEIDVERDLFEMAALQHHATHTLGKRLALWSLGGGASTSYALRGGRLLGHAFELSPSGFDVDVRIGVEPGEGAFDVAQGRDAEGVDGLGVSYVRSDVTALTPWLTYALLSDPRIHRRPRRLDSARAEAARVLADVVEARREKLSSAIARAARGVPAKRSGASKRKTAKRVKKRHS